MCRRGHGIRIHSWSQWPTSLGLLALLLGAQCADSDDGAPGDDAECIGPEGASYAIDDPESAADGARVTVPPGPRDGCWGLGVNSAFYFRFPSGFHAYRDGTAFDVLQWGELPDDIALELSLPVAGIAPPGAGRALAAFWSSPADAPDVWHVVLPDVVDGERMVIRTTKPTEALFEQWSWGWIALDVVDYEDQLEPALEELHGSGDWAAITAELRRIQDSELSGLALDCASLDIVEQTFEGLAADAAGRLVGYQQSLAGACRDCDVTRPELLADFIAYVRLNAAEWFWRELFLETDGVIRIYSMIRLMDTWDQLAATSCDWECYFDRAYQGCPTDLATYWLGRTVVDLAAWGRQQLGCP